MKPVCALGLPAQLCHSGGGRGSGWCGPCNVFLQLPHQPAAGWVGHRDMRGSWVGHRGMRGSWVGHGGIRGSLAVEEGRSRAFGFHSNSRTSFLVPPSGGHLGSWLGFLSAPLLFQPQAGRSFLPWLISVISPVPSSFTLHSVTAVDRGLC